MIRSPGSPLSTRQSLSTSSIPIHRYEVLLLLRTCSSVLAAAPSHRSRTRYTAGVGRKGARASRLQPGTSGASERQQDTSRLGRTASDSVGTHTLSTDTSSRWTFPRHPTPHSTHHGRLHRLPGPDLEPDHAQQHKVPPPDPHPREYSGSGSLLATLCRHSLREHHSRVS